MFIEEWFANPDSTPDRGRTCHVIYFL